MSNTKHLQKAQSTRNDEFYTPKALVEQTLNTVDKTQFKDKIVYCNADTYPESEFINYFIEYFEDLKLKKLIATGMNNILFEYNGHTHTQTKIWSGDYSSSQCLDIMAQADIVVTNPPFSLLADYFYWLEYYKVKYLLITPVTATIYTTVVPAVVENRMTFRYLKKPPFNKPDGTLLYISVYATSNLKRDKEIPFIELSETYSPDKYQKLLNYDAIFIDKVSNIPKDYYDKMAVPVSFLEKHNPKQFRIVDFLHSPYIIKNNKRQETFPRYIIEAVK